MTQKMNEEILTKKFQQALEKIRSAKNILVATHIRPDGDGLASMCALSLLLDKLGKNYHLFCADQAPEHFSFLPNFKKITSKKKFNFFSFDLIIIVDCSALTRTGLADEIVQKKSNQTILEFDHHPPTDNYSDLEIRLPQHSSAAEIIYLFFTVNNIQIGQKAANCLLAGIMTDTGNLLFSSVNEETVKISSALLLRGAAMPKIIKRNNEGKSVAAMKIIGRALEKLYINEKYDLVCSVFTYEEVVELKKEFGEDSAFDAISDIITNLDGIKGSLFLREEEKGVVRGSLRSKLPEINVALLAEKLGGGGHKKAAAFRLNGSIIKTETGWEII
ncbi:MAG: bifunctional oligoribonuclease/PAP phosphatase NrnA [Patescibacteria group bacterium]|jgi:phosphoesterase RecJ-like protein